MFKHKFILMIFLICFVISTPKLIKADVPINNLSVIISPESGDVNTKINIHIEVNPEADHTTCPVSSYLYVYYDDFSEIIKSEPLYSTAGANILVTWDTFILVPNQTPYSNLGLHTIKIIVEGMDGSKVTIAKSFTITNFIPPPDWFDKLNSTIKAKLIGPVGPQGLRGFNGTQGIQGLQGIQGIQGDRGLTGATGAKGDKGDTGATGPQGIQGPQGEIAPEWEFYTIIGFCVMSMAFSIGAFVRSKPQPLPPTRPRGRPRSNPQDDDE